MNPNVVLYRILLLILAMSVLVACESIGTYQKSYKILAGSKVTMESLGTTAKQLHASGVLNDEQLAQAKEVYEAAQAVQKEFIAAQIAAVRSGDTTKQEQIASIGLAYLMAASRFVNLAIQFGLIEADDPNIKTLTVKE